MVLASAELTFAPVCHTLYGIKVDIKGRNYG